MPTHQEREEARLRAELARIDQTARERAAPVLERLTAIKLAKPHAMPILCATCQQPINGTLLGFRCDCAKLGATDALGASFGQVPYNTSDQVRNALLEAFKAEPDSIRADLRKLLIFADDATLERARALIRDR